MNTNAIKLSPVYRRDFLPTGIYSCANNDLDTRMHAHRLIVNGIHDDSRCTEIDVPSQWHCASPPNTETEMVQ